MEPFIITLDEKITTIESLSKPSPSEKKSRKVDIKVEKPVKASTSGIQVDVIDLPFTRAPLALVTRIRALSFDELPSRYTWNSCKFSFPKVWQDGKKLISGERCILLEDGGVYEQSYLQEALLYIELAGRHLAAVNKEKKLHLAENRCTTFKDGVFKLSVTLPTRPGYDKPY